MLLPLGESSWFKIQPKPHFEVCCQLDSSHHGRVHVSITTTNSTNRSLAVDHYICVQTSGASDDHLCLSLWFGDKSCAIDERGKVACEKLPRRLSVLCPREFQGVESQHEGKRTKRWNLAKGPTKCNARILRQGDYVERKKTAIDCR